MVQKSRLRVGAVSFLNTKPLIYPLLNEEIQTDIALSVDVPSRIAALLSEGELEVGLIPIIEYFRANPSDAKYCILPDISIASHGSVKSIQLFSRIPIPEIQRIGLDTNSRSSITLLKILLAEKYQIFPAFTTCRPTVNPKTVLQDRQDPPFDAILLIGDAALRHLGSTEYNLDLGEAWHQLTGLPFVYACWVARTEAQLGDLPELLLESKVRGIARIPEIARIEARKLGLAEELCRNYLLYYIKYDLGESAIKGLELFYKYAVKNDLAPPGRDLSFASK
ncbi:menaquinone biosynthesis protein [Candidatus Poribacteria bacterium]|nr:menaquinone biosynthesis protein [Candidatus Poribacteria bacterium]